MVEKNFPREEPDEELLCGLTQSDWLSLTSTLMLSPLSSRQKTPCFHDEEFLLPLTPTNSPDVEGFVGRQVTPTNSQNQDEGFLEKEEFEGEERDEKLVRILAM